MPKCYPHLASAAWFLLDATLIRLHMFYGVVQVGGPSDHINAYCTELQGMHSLLVALELFCYQHDIQSGSITSIGCNNKGVIQQAQAFHEYLSCSTPQADLVQAIMALRLQSKLSLKFVYIPGHQDTFTQIKDLPSLAHLNIWADSLAKQELHCLVNLPTHPTPSDKLTGETWTASIMGTEIISDLCTPILDYLGGIEACQYWMHKGQLSPETFHLVSWNSLEKATCTYPLMFQMWLSEFTFGHSMVGTTMFHWQKWDSPLCPV